METVENTHETKQFNKRHKPFEFNFSESLRNEIPQLVRWSLYIFAYKENEHDHAGWMAVIPCNILVHQ